MLFTVLKGPRECVGNILGWVSFGKEVSPLPEKGNRRGVLQIVIYTEPNISRSINLNVKSLSEEQKFHYDNIPHPSTGQVVFLEDPNTFCHVLLSQQPDPFPRQQ